MELQTKEEKRIYTKPTFLISLIVMSVFVLYGVLATESFGEGVRATFNFMVQNLGWAFIISVGIFVFSIVFLLLSPLGAIKLGKDDERPAYSNLT